MLNEAAVRARSMTDLIIVFYQGELPWEVAEYIEETGVAAITKTRPLTIISSAGYDILPGILWVLSHSPVKVHLVKVRF